MNQIEVWFGILARKVIRRGNFTSQADLRTRIMDFIDYCNATLAKPFKWTYQGKPLVAGCSWDLSAVVLVPSATPVSPSLSALPNLPLIFNELEFFAAGLGTTFERPRRVNR